ncbi:5-oxoprolinase subunit PxpB [Microbulbifer sp. TRSA007]|uniref:5-oxoprolinase subunit PxpB n=1 Tax=Microbulbifer sp. TRSA007 TaxID=3243384 RepID=UPI0040395662
MTHPAPHIPLAITINGDCAVDIRFSGKPCKALSRTIIGLRAALLNEVHPGIIDIIPAYQCLTVIFNPSLWDHKTLYQLLTKTTEDFLNNPAPFTSRPRIVRIPVCYEEGFSPDLEALSEHTKLSSQEIIKRHTAQRYLVHMLGFTPGFLYLGGLDPKLYCPRKETPRTRIPAGAVGIGGEQTGIYPQATPGGWQIIGQTPLSLFQPAEPSPFIAAPLDEIEFYAIDSQQFHILSQSTKSSSS